MAKPLLEDGLWQIIEPLLPAPKPRRFRYPGRKPLTNPQALTGILFVLKSGIAWNLLPAEMNCGVAPMMRRSTGGPCTGAASAPISRAEESPTAAGWARSAESSPGAVDCVRPRSHRSLNASPTEMGADKFRGRFPSRAR
jgi:hypothetical protein